MAEGIGLPVLISPFGAQLSAALTPAAARAILGITMPDGADAFIYAQTTPAYVWGPIAHGLGRIPVVELLDDDGNVFLSNVMVDDANVTVTSLVALTGKIVCS